MIILPILALGGLALLAMSAGEKPSWDSLRNVAPNGMPPTKTADGQAALGMVPFPNAPISGQEIIQQATKQAGLTVYVNASWKSMGIQILLLSNKSNVGGDWTRLYGPTDAIPAPTYGKYPSPGQGNPGPFPGANMPWPFPMPGGGAPAPAPGSGAPNPPSPAPAPGGGAPNQPPGDQPQWPFPGIPNPLPGMPWPFPMPGGGGAPAPAPGGGVPSPIPGVPGPLPPVALPEPFGSKVQDLRGKLGAVYAIRQMAASVSDPNLANALRATADAEYMGQKSVSAANGGTNFIVKEGHLPYKVAQHYGGTLEEFKAANLGRDMVTVNKDWRVGTTWLLPLSWDAEAKKLAPTLAAPQQQKASFLPKKPKKVNKGNEPSI